MSYLYILEIKPLSVASFTNIFSHSVAYLFIWLMFSFALQKLISLIRSHLFIFVFISITSGDESKKILPQFMSKSVLPMFYSKSFIVSSLKFIYFIYLFFAVLGLCCACAFSICGKWRLLFVVVHRLLIVVASLVRSIGSRHVGFSSCGMWAQ